MFPGINVEGTDVIKKVIRYNKYDKHFYIISFCKLVIWVSRSSFNLSNLKVMMISCGNNFNTSGYTFGTCYTLILWMTVLIVFAGIFVTFIWYSSCFS